MSPLAARWLTGLVGAPAFLAPLILDARAFALVCTVLAALSLQELLHALCSSGRHASPWVAVVGLAAPLSAVFPDAATEFLLGAGCLLAVTVLAAIAGEMRHEREPRLLQEVGGAFFVAGYLGLFGCIAWLRVSLDPVGAGQWPGLQSGAALLIVMCVAIWSCDSLAFFTGKALGKRKLAPTISPNKTMEGGIGGLAGALAFGAGASWLVMGSPTTGLILGAVTGVVGPLGDLFESALKRELGIKDLGSILPGHGGVLDRFDSMLFVAPVTLLLRSLGII